VSQQFHPPSGPRTSRPDPTLGHEERDVAVRPIAWTLVGLIGIVLTVFVFIQVLLNVLAGVQSRRSAAPSPLAGAYGMKEPPAPRLQTDPVDDLRALRARDQALLSGYAWVDRDAGVVRIPIERAKDVLAQRGLPARASAPEEQR
jgi:hypothetical protein